MRGFGAVRRRGAEVGGVLLGKIEPGSDHTLITVENFEAVPCEYAHGPSYILSPADLQKFRNALARFEPSTRGNDIYTVGYYRSHTREGLGPDDQDIRFFREYFPDPLHVLLLVKPFATKASLAGFFIQENGVLNPEKSYLEFPFRRRELGGGAPSNERPDHFDRAAERAARHGGSPVEAPTNAPVPVPAAPEPPSDYVLPHRIPMFSQYQQTASPWKRRLGWAALVVMLIVFGVAVGTQYVTLPFQTGAVSSAGDPYGLSLSASRVDDNILVKWDKQSSAVKNAWRGLLTITEGKDSKTVELDVPQLQNGTVLYRHVAPEITFKLEVFVKEQRSVVETLVWHEKP
jgi:hypothetical protein